MSAPAPVNNNKRPHREEEEVVEEEEEDGEDDVEAGSDSDSEDETGGVLDAFVETPDDDDRAREQEDPKERLRAFTALGPFQLSAPQEVVCAFMVERCQKLGRFINESRAGTGKTPVTCVGVSRLRMPMVVIGLAAKTGMAENWAMHAARQGVDLRAYIGWEALRGSRSRTMDATTEPNVPFNVPMPDNPFLTRTDVWTWHKIGASPSSQKRTKVEEGSGPGVAMRRVYKTVYRPTELWCSMVRDGVALVADEIQRGGGDSLTKSAMAAMAHTIFPAYTIGRGVGGSCIIYLSATTMDRFSNAQNILQAMAFMSETEEPFVQTREDAGSGGGGTARWTPQAAQRLIDSCIGIEERMESRDRCLDRIQQYTTRSDREDVSVVLDRVTGALVERGSPVGQDRTLTISFKTNQSKGQMFCFFVYCMILRKLFAKGVRMPFDADPSVRKEYRAVRYAFRSLDDQAVYESLLAEIAALLKRKGKSKQDVEQLARLRRQLEKSKRSMFIHPVARELRANDHLKALIMLNTIKSIKKVARALNRLGFPTTLIYGKVSGKRRARILRAFNEPSSRLRVIVAQIATMSEGLSAHDTSGEWPRFGLISPSPMTKQVMQALFRCDRFGTKGAAKVGRNTDLVDVKMHIVYGQTDGKFDEKKLIEQMSRNTTVLSSVAAAQVADGVPMPGTLPVYEEFLLPDGSSVMRSEAEAETIRREKERRLQEEAEAARAKKAAEAEAARKAHVASLAAAYQASQLQAISRAAARPPAAAAAAAAAAPRPAPVPPPPAPSPGIELSDEDATRIDKSVARLTMGIDASRTTTTATGLFLALDPERPFAIAGATAAAYNNMMFRSMHEFLTKYDFNGDLQRCANPTHTRARSRVGYDLWLVVNRLYDCGKYPAIRSAVNALRGTVLLPKDPRPEYAILAQMWTMLGELHIHSGRLQREKDARLAAERDKAAAAKRSILAQAADARRKEQEAAAKALQQQRANESKAAAASLIRDDARVAEWLKTTLEQRNAMERDISGGVAYGFDDPLLRTLGPLAPHPITLGGITFQSLDGLLMQFDGLGLTRAQQGAMLCTAMAAMIEHYPEVRQAMRELDGISIKVPPNPRVAAAVTNRAQLIAQMWLFMSRSV